MDNSVEPKVNSKGISKGRRIFYSILGLALSFGIAAAFWIFKDQVQARASLSYLFLFLACMGSHASVLIPSSATVIIMAAAAVLNPLICGIAGGLGGALGEHTSYICGRSGQVFVENSKLYRWLLPRVEKHGFLWVFLLSFVPLPVYDLAGLTAGVTGMKLTRFSSACALGIVPKSIAYAYFGVYALELIEKYFILLPGDIPQYIAEYIETLTAGFGL